MSDRSQIISQNKATMKKIADEIVKIAKQESEKLKKSSGYNYLTDGTCKLYTDSDSYYIDDKDEDDFGMFCLLNINTSKIKADDDFDWNDWSDTIFELVRNINKNKTVSKYGQASTEQPDDGDCISFYVKTSLLQSVNDKGDKETVTSGKSNAEDAAKEMEKQLKTIKVDGFTTSIKVYKNYGGIEILGRIEKSASDKNEIKNRKYIVSEIRKQYNTAKKDVKKKYGKSIVCNEPDELCDVFSNGKYSILFGIVIYDNYQNESVELWEQEIVQEEANKLALYEASIYNFYGDPINDALVGLVQNFSKTR